MLSKIVNLATQKEANPVQNCTAVHEVLTVYMSNY